MGNYYDTMFRRFEEQANRSGMLNGMTSEQKSEFFGQMALRIEKERDRALANGLSGAGSSNLPAPIVPSGSSSSNLPIAVSDPVELSTKNDGIRVVKKWSKGKNCYLTDGSGNFYKVDKTTYNAAATGKKIQLPTKDVVDFDKLPKEAQSQFKKYLPKPSEAAKQGIAETAANAVKNPNPSHPSNAVLGSGKADSKTWRDRLPANWDDVASNNTQQISTKTIIDQNKQNLDDVAEQATKKGLTPTHGYKIVNDPDAYRAQQQKMYEEVFKDVDDVAKNVPTQKESFTRNARENYIKKYGYDPLANDNLLGKKNDHSGFVKILNSNKEKASDVAEQATKKGLTPTHGYNIVNDPDAYRAQQQKMYEEVFKDVDDVIPNSKVFPMADGKDYGKKLAEQADDITKKLTDKVDDVIPNSNIFPMADGKEYGKKLAEQADDITKKLADKVDDVIPNSKVFPIADGEKYAKMLKENPIDKPGVWSKIKSFANSKGGKAAIAIGAVALAVGIGIWAYNKFKSKDGDEKISEETNVTPEATPEKTQVAPTPTPVTPIPEPSPVTPTSEPVAPTPEPVTPKPDKTDVSNKRKVIEGDTCWDIAEDELKKEYKQAGKDPKSVTNAQIRKRTEKIIEVNEKKWEADGYTVIIHPGEMLNVAS